MEFDIKTSANSWDKIAKLARNVEVMGASGLLFTEAGHTPWMMMTAAAIAAPSLQLSTGIAVAFPRSPMVTAQIAWELAGNTKGKFRLGLGSQVKPHIERRYGVDFEKPAMRMRDYMLAVRACFNPFRGEARLEHEGPFQLDPEEISEGGWFTPNKIDDWIVTSPEDFAPAFLLIWRRLQTG